MCHLLPTAGGFTATRSTSQATVAVLRCATPVGHVARSDNDRNRSGSSTLRVHRRLPDRRPERRRPRPAGAAAGRHGGGLRRRPTRARSAHRRRPRRRGAPRRPTRRCWSTAVAPAPSEPRSPTACSPTCSISTTATGSPRDIPGAIVIPGALAVAQRVDATPTQLLEASWSATRSRSAPGSRCTSAILPTTPRVRGAPSASPRRAPACSALIRARRSPRSAWPSTTRRSLR